MVVPEPRSRSIATGSTPIGPLVLANGDEAPAAGWRLESGWKQLRPGTEVPAVPVSFAVEHVEAPPTGPDQAEGHQIEIGARGVILRAARPTGVRRAVETLLQLAAAGPLPWGVIDDAPRLRWRGLLVDVARQWIPLDRLRQTVDAMATAKLNVLHLHLSDDQAFRVQSLVHPRLHEVGSGGRWYDQDEIRALVHHAARAGIRVVPEFDMPGHTTSWLAAHPELAATPGPFSLRSRAGVAEVGLRPDDPEVLEFVRSLLAEMAGLFPDAYLHIGGDEVHPRAWPDHDVASAQARFTDAVVAMVLGLGKVPVVWDEAWHPGLDRSVVVQVWRGHARFRAAAAAGHPVLLSSPYYLDLALDPAHHRVDPLAEAASSDAARARVIADPRVGAVGEIMAAVDADWSRGVTAPDTVDPAAVLGGEACMWTELCPPHLLALRLWPAAAVVAEVLWSDPWVGHDPVRLDAFVSALAATTDTDVEADRLTHWLRLSDGDPDLAGHLATLATCCEPVKWYSRHLSLPDGRIDGPFDRFVDGLEPAARAPRAGAPVRRYRSAAEAVSALGPADHLPARAGELVAVAQRVLERCAAVEDPTLPAPSAAPVGEVLVVWPSRDAARP